MLPAERFSQVPEEGQRNSHERVIDLSDPSRRETEIALSEQEKSEEIITLAKIANARAGLISTLFERGTHTQDTKRTAELIEETHYWLEDLNQQLQFIHDHREETGNETDFSQAATALIEAKKILTSELDHMLEIVAIWHEDDPQEEVFSDILATEAQKTTEAEASLEDINDKGTIVETAPEAVTMLTSENEQARQTDSVTDAAFLLLGYHVGPANNTTVEDTNFEGISPAEELILKKETNISESASPAQLIDIPSDLTETRTKYSALNRTARDIETAIKRNPQFAERTQFDNYLLDLAHRYSAFEERLTMLERHTGPETEETREEKELVHDALALIEDMRHKIREINFVPKTKQEQQVERLLALKIAKKQRLESVVDRLTSAIERSGIKNPELYMVEQASGLGNIRRGLMSLIGKKESLINKATLTKLKNEAIGAEQQYFNEAYNGVNDKAMPFYEKAVEKSRILKLKDSDDVHEIWEALHHEMEDLGEQVDVPEAAQLYEGHGIAKVNKTVHEAEVVPVQKEQYEKKTKEDEQRAAAAEYRKNEFSPSKVSTLNSAMDIYRTIKGSPASSELTFTPDDYIGALASLKLAVDAKDINQIQTHLPRVKSMKNELMQNSINTAKIATDTIPEDTETILRANKVLKSNGISTRKKRS